MSKTSQPTATKSGVAAALNHLGFHQNDGPFPPSMKSIASAPEFTADELSFAEYMIYDTDFGGCWNRAEQIDMHLA